MSTPPTAVAPAPCKPYIREFERIFEEEFTNSFEGFTTSWSENCLLTFSRTVASKISEIVKVFENGDYIEFIDWILQFIESTFLPFQFKILLEVGYADDEFFDLLLSVIDFLTHVFKVTAEVLKLDTSMEEYKQRFGSVDLVTYLVQKSSEMLFSAYEEKIMTTILRRVRFLRESHSYHDSVFWNALQRTSLGKVAEVLNRVPETEKYGEFVRQYESELIHDVKAYIEKIPLATSEKRFLITMRECVEVEEAAYTTLICPDVEVYHESNTAILDMFHDQHKRRRAARIFKDMDYEMLNPDARFSGEYFRDLFALYIFREGEESNVNLRTLTSSIRDSFLHIVQRHADGLKKSLPHSEPLEPFVDVIEDLCLHRNMIRARFAQISDSEVLSKALYSASSQLSFSHLSTMDYAHQLRAASKHAIDFLCNCNIKTEDEFLYLTLIVNYYFFITQHALFMNDLYTRLRVTALHRIPLPVDRLKKFIRWIDAHAKASKKVECLVQDLSASIGMGGEDSTSLLQTSSNLKCDTCLIVRSRYWASAKNQSKYIRPWSQIRDMEESVTQHLEKKLDKDRQLIPMHCMSRVVLKTTLFTISRKFTCLDMLQYQCMVLMLCEKQEPIRMSEVVRSMCVEKFEAESERDGAEKFVGLLVKSLVCPYPLLEIKQNTSANPDDPVLSINHNFAFDEDEVRLPGDHLLLDEDVSF